MPESFFKKVEGLRSETLLKRDSGTGVFLFCEISRNTFFTEHIWATASETMKSN